MQILEERRLLALDFVADELTDPGDDENTGEQLPGWKRQRRIEPVNDAEHHEGHHGHSGISAFWEKAIAPIATFEFDIYDSFANPESNTCANIGRIRTSFPDGSYTVTDLIMVYIVDDDGRVRSMKAFWEPDRTMASFTKA